VEQVNLLVNREDFGTGEAEGVRHGGRRNGEAQEQRPRRHREASGQANHGRNLPLAKQNGEIIRRLTGSWEHGKEALDAEGWVVWEIPEVIR
jgi:hypothetical protein